MVNTVLELSQGSAQLTCAPYRTVVTRPADWAWQASRPLSTADHSAFYGILVVREHMSPPVLGWGSELSQEHHCCSYYRLGCSWLAVLKHMAAGDGVWGCPPGKET